MSLSDVIQSWLSSLNFTVEAIQSDSFDHMPAIAGLFDPGLYQFPSNEA